MYKINLPSKGYIMSPSATIIQHLTLTLKHIPHFNDNNNVIPSTNKQKIVYFYKNQWSYNKVILAPSGTVIKKVKEGDLFVITEPKDINPTLDQKTFNEVELMLLATRDELTLLLEKTNNLLREVKSS